jgi:biopolymer transport protein ExbD
MNLRKHLREAPEGHTSALNDILFILVFFFIILSTLANPNLVKVSLPKAASDSKAKQTVVVTVDSLEKFYIGTTPVVIDSLQSGIQKAVAKTTDAEPTVVINGDARSRHGDILAVMKAAKALKLKTVVAVQNEGVR